MSATGRVLVISRHPYPVGTTLRRNLTQLVAWGLAVDVVCLTTGFRWGAPVADQPGLRLYGIPIKASRTHAFSYPLHYAMFFLWALGVVSLLGLRRGYDVIEVDNTPDFLVFTTVLARIRTRRTVLFALELMPELTAARLRLKSRAFPVRLAVFLERAAGAWVDHVIAVSELCRRILVGRGLPSDKVTVVPNSHPIANLEPARPAQPPFLVIQTTLIERYGVHVAIEALAQLRSEWPELTLHILGQGESEPRLIELSKRLGLDDRVHFSHGYLPWRSMMDQVRQATIGIVPLLADGYGDLCLPNKVLEFVALGIPVVSSRLPAIAEHFPEDCLAYFDPGDAAGLAAQLRRLLADPVAARRQACLARDAMHDLAWDSVSLRYRDALGLATPQGGALVTSNRMLSTNRSAAAVSEAPPCASNSPAAFWKLLDPVPAAEEWSEAAAACAHILPPSAAAKAGDAGGLMEAVLSEGQFGAGHWRLGAAKRTYYDLKRLLPRPVIRTLRRAYGRDDGRAGGLSWPSESRYADFLQAVLASVLERRGLTSAKYLSLWPDDRRLAFVLTHDVEMREGHDFVMKVVELEERHGFRSSFNFVPERYRTDPGLVVELKARGFEVGVHDLNHDGKLFRSRAIFDARAERINAALARTGATGFRAAYTHRNPEWMQALNLEYDLSFFDSDPFEPIPGGTMSLWPFMLGRFVELPYTLVQDYTLTEVLGETTPKLWLEKVEFIAARRGMALLNSHPDYLRTSKTWKVYEGFLSEMAGRTDLWHALPKDAARWWRARLAAPAGQLPAGAAWATLARATW